MRLPERYDDTAITWIGHHDMSYILDALKKSEAKRTEKQDVLQLQPRPPLPASAPEPAGSRFWVLFWIIVITSPPLSYALYSQLSGQHDETPVTAEAPSREIEREALKTSAETAGPEQSRTIPELRPSHTKKSPDSTEHPAVFEPAPLGVPRPPPPLPSSVFSSVPYLEELDQSFRKSVPEFKLAGHVYAQDPALRMILINDRIVREKDVVAKDYILEEITPEGVILRFGDTRFRLDGY